MPKLRFICKTKEHFTVPELKGSFSVLYGLRCIFHDATGLQSIKLLLDIFHWMTGDSGACSDHIQRCILSQDLLCVSLLNKQTLSAAISPLRGCLHYILAICT